MTSETGLYEFETKYRVSDAFRHEFKNIVHPYADRFFYAESDDTFFTNGENDRFMRHRLADAKYSGGKNELTLKVKTRKTNNFKRIEVNMDINNTKEQVRVFCEELGYKWNNQIFKYTDVYSVENAVLAFYTVRSVEGDLNHFVEIETTQNLLDKEAWEVIQLWESRLGLQSSDRLKKSLFEMYRK